MTDGVVTTHHNFWKMEKFKFLGIYIWYNFILKTAWCKTKQKFLPTGCIGLNE